MRYKPELDGIDHINIYSKEKTELGRLLSNFSYSPVILDQDGQFNSIEGYWYWLLCSHSDRDKLRGAWSPEAKEMGRFLRAKDWPTTDAEWFESKIKLAILKKTESSKRIQQLLTEVKLPFAHYYVYKNKASAVDDSGWFIKSWDLMRQYCVELKEIEKDKKAKA